MTASIFWPFLKIMTVGMLRMPYSVATLGDSSVFSFSCRGERGVAHRWLTEWQGGRHSGRLVCVQLQRQRGVVQAGARTSGARTSLASVNSQALPPSSRAASQGRRCPAIVLAMVRTRLLH